MKARQFLEQVWGPQGEGTAFISGKGQGGDWHEHPLHWPTSSAIELPPKSADIYFCPNLFSGNARRVNEVQPSCWLYADLDEVSPRGLPLKPTIAWESSSKRYQALWKLKGKIKPNRLQDLNKRLTYLIGADKGGWDLTQVLRLPGTYNHKYDEAVRVTLLWDDGPSYATREVKRAVKDVDPGAGLTEVDDLVVPKASAATIYRKHRRQLSPRTKRLLQTKRVAEGERSDRLWELENLLLDAGMKPEEVFVLIRDSPWNKYRGRADETYRIWLEIQKAARTKATLESAEATSTQPYNPAPTGWEHHDLFMQAELAPPSWMVDGIWSDRSHGIIAGEPKGYKSLIATDLAISVASGAKFLGHYDTNVTGPVLMVQEENSAWLMQSRIRKIEAHRGLLGEAHIDGSTLTISKGKSVHLELLNQSGFDLTDPSHLGALERKVQVVRPALVIFDPLYMMLGDADENSTRDIRPILQWLLHLKVRYSTGVLLVHHYSKQGQNPRYGGQRLRGSSAFHGWVESALYVEKPDPNNPFLIEISREHREQPPQGKFEVEVRTGDPTDDDDFELNVYDQRIPKAKRGPLFRFVVNHEGVTIPRIARAKNMTKDKVIRWAEKEGLEIRTVPQKGGGKPVRALFLPGPDSRSPSTNV